MTRRALVRNASVVGSLTFFSRILGLVRDIVFASFFGASKAWDVFVIAFVVPNMFRHLFGEGALSSAFIPAFVRRRETESKESANALLNQVLGWLLMVLGAIVAVGIGLTFLLAEFVQDDKFALILETLRITLPYMILICTTAVIGGALNGMGRFASPAAAPILLNVVLIAGALASPAAGEDMAKVRLLAWSVIAGGLIQFVAQLPSLRAEHCPLRPSFDFRDPGLRDVLAALAPAVAGLGTSLRQAARLSLFVALPAAAGLAALAPDIVGLLFERGKFDPEATARAAPVVAAYCLGIPFFAANMVLTRGLYALRDMKTPVRVSLTTVGINLLLNLALVVPMREAGIALATGITGVLNFLLLDRALRSKLPAAGGDIGWGLRALIASGLCAAAAWAFLRYAWPSLGWNLGGGILGRAVPMLSAIAVGGLAYFAAAAALRLSEARQLFSFLRRR